MGWRKLTNRIRDILGLVTSENRPIGNNYSSTKCNRDGQGRSGRIGARVCSGAAEQPCGSTDGDCGGHVFHVRSGIGIYMVTSVARDWEQRLNMIFSLECRK